VIGLDANVLLRFIAQDDVAQSGEATELIESRLTPENPGFVSIVAMVETVWVLKRTYRLSDLRLAAAIERVLQIEVLFVENEPEVFAAMIALKKGDGSFSDSLIGALGKKAGCSSTVTFDKRALRLPGFAPVHNVMSG
jgi:predicted nucleic-acid-binding protein